MRYKFFSFSLALIILFSTNSLTAKTPKTLKAQEESRSDFLELDAVFANKVVQAFPFVLDNKFYLAFLLMEGLETPKKYETKSLEDMSGAELDIKLLREFYYNNEKIEKMKLNAFAMDVKNHSYVAYELIIYASDISGKIKKYRRIEYSPPVGTPPFFNYSEKIECNRGKDNDVEFIEIIFPLK